MSPTRFLWVISISLGVTIFSAAAILLLSQTQSFPSKLTETEAISPIQDKAICEQKYATMTFGYETCFPADWQYFESGQDKEIVSLFPSSDSSDNDETELIMIRVTEAKSSDVLVDLRNVLTTQQERRVSLGEKDASEIEGEIKAVDGIQQVSTIAVKDRYTYEITLHGSSALVDQYRRVYDALLASWKWVEITKHAPARSASGNIILELPIYDALISGQLTLKGQVRSFEGAFSWRLKNAQGNVISSGFGTASGGQPGQLQSFSKTVRFSRPKPPDSGTLELYTISSKDESEQDLVILPIRFK